MKEGVPRKRWFQFRLITLFVVFAIVAAVLGTCMWMIQADRVFRTEIRFYQTLLALRLYDSIYDSLPPPIKTDGSGKPLSSWRLQLMPYVHRDRTGQAPRPDFDGHWNSAANRAFSERFGYYCLGSSRMRRKRCTNIFAITGAGTAFDDAQPCSIEDLDPNTILIVEVRDCGVHWTQPGDFDVRTMPREIGAPNGRGISGTERGGFHVGFADLQVWRLRSDVPFATLEKFFTSEGAKRRDRERLLRPYCIQVYPPDR